ncbi:S-acyltransferase-like [Raphidocelis subcapitata]|uniref:S-acyltransferase n=1 Tax=Raphidocelis subcapitata TaxID=307507 RepID=A0A2V0NVZ7_9CHLO|nr:S-acyltransferase-like [Raphidocelis subcapitata]|eukprot:GBF91499.1 S-acyltransferase-like [Raphidocelis subcapitata]
MAPFSRGKADAPPRRLRVYQQWQGNERFFCCGHCMAGPNWRSCIGSLLLLVLPTVVFLVWVASYMGRRVSWAIFVVSCILPALSAMWLLLTACRDPGVLPRQEPDEEWLSGRKPRTKEVVVNGHPVQVRYNDTCHFYQPPRAHHCSVNDNCIERFDHHCPWVGTTIGKRNYRTFLLFIYGTTVYIGWTFAISLWSFWVKAAELRAANKEVDILSVISADPAAVALGVFCFVFFWFVGGLSGFHTFLVATNQTTYENFSVWCIRVPPPKMDYRAYVGEVRKAAAASARAAEPPSVYGPSDDGEPRSLDGARASSSGGPALAEAAAAEVAESDAAAAAAAAAAAPEHVSLEMAPMQEAASSRGGRGRGQQQQEQQQQQQQPNGRPKGGKQREQGAG